MTQVKVALMVAMAENRCIGIDNQLPWHLPEDLKYFKRTTLGKPVIMGRKTFESIGRPLPGRPNIVVTRNPEWSFEGVSVATSLSTALADAKLQAEQKQLAEVVIIGGAQIYAEAMPIVERMYITQVHAEVVGDAFFPEFDAGQWSKISNEDYAADERNPYNYSFECWDKL